jgi:hypothetical protein
MCEIWKDIKGYEGLYQVSNQGRIKSFPRKVNFGRSWRMTKEKFLSPALDSNNYPFVTLSVTQKHFHLSIHRAVAEAFLDNPKELREVNHINGCKIDNYVENLEWISSSDNKYHALDNDLKAHGQDCSFSKLTNEDVFKIKSLRNTMSQLAIAKQFNISQAQVCRIQTGKEWKQLNRNV